MDDRKKVDRVVRICGKIVGENPESLSDLYKKRCLQKAKTIISDDKHVLACKFELLPSGRRFREPFDLVCTTSDKISQYDKIALLTYHCDNQNIYLSNCNELIFISFNV